MKQDFKLFGEVFSGSEPCFGSSVNWIDGDMM